MMNFRMAGVVVVAAICAAGCATGSNVRAQATPQPAPEARVCLHGAAETPPEAARRRAALTFVRAVNTAQARLFSSAKSYQPTAGLGALPAVPEGFASHILTDGSSYLLAVRDTADPCRFTWFSDQIGLIYSGTPLQ